MNHRDKKDLLKELEAWQGVTGHSFVVGKKHRKLIVETKAGSKFVTFSASASDRRAVQNQIKDLRKVLKELGATQGNDA